MLQTLTAGLSDKETHDALTRAILKDKGHEEMSLGLLVIILTEPKNATKVHLIAWFHSACIVKGEFFKKCSSCCM